jgi:hypothetical protein
VPFAASGSCDTPDAFFAPAEKKTVVSHSLLAY